MKKVMLAFIIFAITFSFIAQDKVIKLPAPSKDLEFSKLLEGRESIRKFNDKPLELKELSNLLWAANGLKESGKKRTIPSAGALYPLEIYVLVRNVNGLSQGIYRYDQDQNSLVLIGSQDRSKELLKGAIRQEWVATAPVIILISYLKSKTESKYGEKAKVFIPLEAGASMQNIYLMAQTLGLGTCAVGAFNEEEIKRIFNLKEETPIILMPVGKI